LIYRGCQGFDDELFVQPFVLHSGNAVANPEHLKLINRGVKRWNHWRKANFAERPDLSGADLRGCDLSGVNFIGANLSEANLKQAYLKGAFLRFANLVRADLGSANLSEADLNSAQMMGADLRQAQVYKADLCRTNLSNADLQEIQGNQTFFIEANLEHSILIAAQLSQAILTDTNLRSTNLSNADLSKADLSFTDLSHANLTHTNLSKVVCIEGKINGADLRGSNLYCANFQYTSFRDALLQGADLSGGNFGEVDFTSADLRDANLKDAKVTDAKFQAAQLQGAQIVGTYFSPEQLSNSDLQNTQGSPAAILFTHESLISEVTLEPLTIFPLTPSQKDSNTLIQLPDHLQPELSAKTRSQSLLTLAFVTAVDWIALAIVLKHLNSSHDMPILKINSIDSQLDGSTLVRLGLDEAFDPETIKHQVLTEYEDLHFTLAKTIRHPHHPQDLLTPHNRLSRSNSSIDLLLDLLITNLL
jgi:uncharacterized protein YjbI with pentapeptide repeats